MSALWSSFVGYFSNQEKSLVHAPASGSNSGEVENLVREFSDIYGQLKAMKSLKPSNEVDALFGRLVDHCILNRDSEITEKVLQDPRLVAIRSDFRLLCDVAECCLEFHWADIVISKGHSTPKEVYKRLTRFPYFQNYIDLTKLELSAINGVRNATSPISKIAFLGSGPLPLTSLCLCGIAGDPLHLPGVRSSSISVLNIDNNAMAISTSVQLKEQLGAHGMEFKLSDAGKQDVDLMGFDVVYLAALVGGTQKEKETVLVSVVESMSEGALLVVRSADRLRQILYPAFDPSSELVLRYLDICAVVHPFNHVVNSVVIGRVKKRGEGMRSSSLGKRETKGGKVR